LPLLSVKRFLLATRRFLSVPMPYCSFRVESVIGLFCLGGRTSDSRVRVIPRNFREFSVAQQQPQGEAHDARHRRTAGFPHIDGLASDPKLARKSGLVEAEQAADNPHLLARLFGVTYIPPRSSGCRRASVRADRYSHFLGLIELSSHDGTHIALRGPPRPSGKFTHMTPRAIRHSMIRTHNRRLAGSQQSSYPPPFEARELS
jgi:hypothetical protein